MKICQYSLQELGVKVIDLGKRGENRVRQVEFDLRDWIAEYPGASVALYISQPNTTVYLATTNMVDGVLKWPIIDTYTAIPGFGDAEIVLSGTDGERLKSVTASIFVNDSLSDGVPGEAPDYMRPYVDQVAENAAKAEKALEEIKNIGLQSGNMPTGGSSGQILAKKSAENYDTHWIDPPSGGGTGGGGTADSVAWENVTGKPETYPPASHTHSEYLGKNETAANATKLNGKDADQYMLKTDTAADADKLGGVAASEYIQHADALTLEEIQASTDLAGKVPNAESLKIVDITDEISVTVTTGTYVSHSAYKFGNVVSFTIKINPENEIAPGNLVASMTISKYRPVAIPTSVIGYGTRMYYARLNAGGWFGVEPMAVNSVSTDELSFGFTYITGQS